MALTGVLFSSGAPVSSSAVSGFLSVAAGSTAQGQFFFGDKIYSSPPSFLPCHLLLNRPFSSCSPTSPSSYLHLSTSPLLLYSPTLLLSSSTTLVPSSLHPPHHLYSSPPLYFPAHLSSLPLSQHLLCQLFFGFRVVIHLFSPSPFQLAYALA
jgi:hypothetical protein